MNREERRAQMWRKRLAFKDAAALHKNKKPVRNAQKLVDDLKGKLSKQKDVARKTAGQLHKAEAELRAALNKYVPEELRD